MIAWEQEVERMSQRIHALETVLREIRVEILRRWDFPANADVELLETIDTILGQLPKCGACESPTIHDGVCLHCGAREDA
jgi:hypothetical protein